jgi:hypothetical protein
MENKNDYLIDLIVIILLLAFVYQFINIRDENNTGDSTGNNTGNSNNTEHEDNCNLQWITYEWGWGLSETFNTTGNVNRIIEARVHVPQHHETHKEATIIFLLGSTHYQFNMFIDRNIEVYAVIGFMDYSEIIAYVWEPYNEEDDDFEAIVKFNTTSDNSIRIIPKIIRKSDQTEIYNGEGLNIYGDGDTITILELARQGKVLKCG